MLRRNLDIEDVALVDLFSSSGFSNVLSLVLDPDDLSNPLSTAIDKWILRFDDPVEYFDSYDGWIVTSKDESFQQFDLSGAYEKVHLGLCTSELLGLDPSRILF